jgi:hypothetical protein
VTESEWLTCTNPTDMLFVLRSRISDRKLRLIAAACCRRIWHLISDERSRKAVEWAERDADELLGEDRIATARAAGDALAHAYSILDLRRGNGQLYHAAWAAALSVYTPEVPLQTPVNLFEFHETIDCARDVLVHSANAYGVSIHNAHGTSGKDYSALNVACEDEYAQQSNLIRDICGNPFRTVALVSDWLAPAVITTARAIYNKGAFDRMPILGDVLEEAGCDNEDVLSHCRTQAEHVRGCWLVDAILGKS